MRAVVVGDVDHVTVEDVAAPVREDAALVAPEILGLCGTDLKIVSGAIPVSYPRVLGHEMVGRVVRPAADGRIAEGTRVLVDPAVSCGRCRLCRADRSHLCPSGALLGREVDGVFADLVAVDDALLHPVPEHLSVREAATLQVLGTCVHAHTLVDVFPGQSAAVIGLGVSGLLHVQLLRARGVEHVVGITRSAWKRQLAEDLGATATAEPAAARAVIDELTGGAGVDLVIESAGVGATFRQAVELAAIGSRLLIFGIISSPPDGLNWYELYYKELDIINARAARPRDYDRGVALAASGALRLAPLWSRGVAFDDAVDAFAMARSDDTLKVTLHPEGGWHDAGGPGA
ncbi:MAG TPA: alcohol dehydrogenase catalytic domain-containing protein [Euzebyales bacterium]|nr:alcohol dehydrogenase catalytic domain-containing protein [Euzebyales bacterium]